MNMDSMCASPGEVNAWEQLDWTHCEQKVRRLQARIVKATNRLRSRGALQRLEPDEGKLSCPVLRGGSGSNATSLPDAKRQRLPSRPRRARGD
jgi:hypothetical protein